MQPKRVLILLVAALVGVSTPLRAAEVTAPKAFFGFNLGDDYCLANYKQFTAYFKKLESESDRFRIVNIGLTEEGRDQLMGIVTAPANHAKIAHYQAIARKLALADGISPAEAKKLALDGK